MTTPFIPFAGYSFHVVARYGLSTQVPVLKLGEMGYDTDTKVGRFGDDTSTPPRVMTDKSSAPFDFSSVPSVKFNQIEIEENGTVDGVDISSMITATGFLFHAQAGQFANVRFVSSNQSISFGGLTTAEQGGGMELDVTLNQALMDLINGGFNIADIDTVLVLPDQLQDPILRYGDALYFWNKNTARYEYVGIPTFTTFGDIPTVAGPVAYVDATDPTNQKMMFWNGVSYEYVGGGSRVHVGPEEPPSPSEGQWWKDTDDYTRKVRLDHVWEEVETASPSSPTGLTRTAFWEQNRLDDEGYVWEMFVPHKRFNQRDFDAVPVQTVANDDTMVVANSNLFVVGATYAVFTADGVVGEVTILNKPNLTSIRVTETFNTTLEASDNAFIGPTSFTINPDASASVEGYHVYYSRNNNVLHDWANGYLVIRREANGKGVIRVFYRESGTDFWKESELEKSQGVEHEPQWSEQFYAIPLSRVRFDTKVTFEGENNVSEKIKHMVWMTNPEQLDTFRVEKPFNVSPADQAVSVGQTPTLTLSPYESIYNITQGGAHFQISRDPKFYDLVLDTSSEPLVSFAATAGQSAIFNDVLMYQDRKGILVGANGTIRATDDGALTFTNGTTAHASKAIHAVTWNGVDRFIAVGEDGTAQYSSDRLAWTAAAGVDGFAGDINGVAAYGNNVVAVGATGKILISVNKGVNYASAIPAASYAGAFSKVVMNAQGRCIAVGGAGEIQTSPDFGQSWQKRTQAGSYAGTWNDVSMTEDGFAIAVGTNGEVQTSNDFGATWIHRSVANGYTGSINGVSINGIYAVFVGANGEIQTSKNRGQTWVKRPQAGGVSTAWNAVALNGDRYAFLAGAAGGIQHSFVLEGAVGNTYTVPSGADLLETNKIYYWRGRYQDDKGYWSEWSDRTAFATQATFNYIGQPSNLLPANDASSIARNPTLVTTAFVSGGQTPDTHYRTQYQVSTSASFETTIYDSGNVADLTSHQVPTTLSAFTTYYWRARHIGAAIGAGPWSIPTRFSTQAAPNAPTITAPTNASTGQPLTLLIKTSAFINSDPNVQHQYTQYQISTNNTFTAIVYDSGDSTDKLQHQVPVNALAPNTQYFVRARHKGLTTDWSAWSASVSFTTIAITVNTPQVTASQIASNTVTLSTNAFSVAGGTDTHASTDWEIRTAPNGGGSVASSSYNDTVNRTEITLAGLEPNTTYYFRVRHRGTNFGASDWGTGTGNGAFTTSVAYGEATFVIPGIYAFTVPPGVTQLSAVAIGGGGAATAGGGGGGGLRFNTFSVTPGSIIYITVGGGGAGTSNGGTSSVGSQITAFGGRGGTYPTLWDLLFDPFGVGKGGQGGTGAGGLGGDGGRGSSQGFLTYVNGGGGGAGGYWGSGGAGAGMNTLFNPGPSTAGVGGGGGGGGGRNGGGTGLHGAGPSGRGAKSSRWWSAWNQSKPGAHGSPSYVIVDYTTSAANTGQRRADYNQSAYNQTPRDFRDDVNPSAWKREPETTIVSGQIFKGFKHASYILGPKERSFPIGWGGGQGAGDNDPVPHGAVRLIWGQGRSYPSFTDNQASAYNYADEA